MKSYISRKLPLTTRNTVRTFDSFCDTGSALDITPSKKRAARARSGDSRQEGRKAIDLKNRTITVARQAPSYRALRTYPIGLSPQVRQFDSGQPISGFTRAHARGFAAKPISCNRASTRPSERLQHR